MKPFPRSTLVPLRRGLCAAAAAIVLSGTPVALGEEPEPRAGIFLVAAPSLADPNFAHAVILITHHGAGGTLGVVVNRPTSIPLDQALPDVPGLAGRSDPLFRGGPVSGHTLLLLLQSRAVLPSSARVLEDVWISFRIETLAALVDREGAGAVFRAYAGYAGWAPGQLEFEIERGTWLLVRADADTIFRMKAGTVWEEMLLRASELLTRSGTDGAGSVVGGLDLSLSPT